MLDADVLVARDAVDRPASMMEAVSDPVAAEEYLAEVFGPKEEVRIGREVGNLLLLEHH